MLEKQIIVNIEPSETRIAIIEKSQVAEIFIGRKRDRSLVGDIYYAKVEKILPGMQSAFVDIGEERAAFLFGGDVFTPDILQKKPPKQSDDDELDREDLEQYFRAARVPIEKALSEHKQILVQVAKDSIGTKGPRITMFLTIPGRYLVLMPQVDHVGVSKKITDPALRQKLKSFLLEARSENLGVIARTAAAEASSTQLEADLKHLTTIWQQIRTASERNKAPYLCYSDLNIVARTVRDFYTDETSKIVIDSEKDFNETKTYLQNTIPSAVAKMELYRDKTPIFDLYGIEMDLRKALERRIDLPSGGYLVVDQTEALTSFDVNTGRYVGRSNQNDTILKTNLEAVQKVAWQIRFRNIGGIIIIDFIDMDDAQNREAVYNALMEALKPDKARTNVLKMSELGLVQMTRKRTSDSLSRVLLDECALCGGKGRVKSTVTEAYELLRELSRFLTRSSCRDVVVRARNDIRDWILSEEKEWLQEIVQKFDAKVEFQALAFSLDLLKRPNFEMTSK